MCIHNQILGKRKLPEREEKKMGGARARLEGAGSTIIFN